MTPAVQLIQMLDGLVLHQLLYAAASLGLADLLENGPLSTEQIACELNINESALYRMPLPVLLKATVSTREPSLGRADSLARRIPESSILQPRRGKGCLREGVENGD